MLATISTYRKGNGMRSGFAVTAMLASMTACIRPPEDAANGDHANKTSAAPPTLSVRIGPPTAPENAAGRSVEPGTRLPPADATYRYVGRWAPDVRQCEDGAWRFEERRLSTAKGASCNFKQVNPVPGGYDISATCSAEGTKADDTLELRFAESARALLVESKTFKSMGLIFCGATSAFDKNKAIERGVAAAPV